jgi:glycerol-3-phosphate acyltransferase PlsY
MLTTYLTVALVAYLLGSIPFGYILVKLFLKQDIRQTGSGNIGATNVARSGKKGLAIATLLLDAGKGLTAVFLASYLTFIDEGASAGVRYTQDQEFTIWTFAALVAIAGHCFPVWLKFKGGKGVATGVGAFFLVSPVATGVAFLIFIVSFALSRFVSLSSVLSALAFPFLALYFRPSPPIVLLILLSASGLIILKHHSNIRRLLNGTEPKFGEKKPAIPTDPIQVEKNA